MGCHLEGVVRRVRVRLLRSGFTVSAKLVARQERCPAVELLIAGRGAGNSLAQADLT